MTEIFVLALLDRKFLIQVYDSFSTIFLQNFCIVLFTIFHISKILRFFHELEKLIKISGFTPNFAMKISFAETLSFRRWIVTGFSF